MDPTLSRLSAELEEGHWWFTARAEILAAVCRELVPGRARVVEVGCGTGNVLGALPDDWDRVGVDMSPDAVDIAAARYPALELSVGRAPDDVRGELIRADLVLFCDVLEHIEDDPENIMSPTIDRETSVWLEDWQIEAVQGEIAELRACADW